MSENIEGAKNFINEHLNKIFLGILIYFIQGLASDFKDVKTTLQTILVNQATMEIRMSNKESNDKKQDEDIEKLKEYHNRGNKEDK